MWLTFKKPKHINEKEEVMKYCGSSEFFLDPAFLGKFCFPKLFGIFGFKGIKPYFKREMLREGWVLFVLRKVLNSLL